MWGLSGVVFGKALLQVGCGPDISLAGYGLAF
jgi:hypothetical protein